MVIYTRSSLQNLIIRDSELGKTNVVLNFISQQDDIDKIYLYTKDFK